MIIEKTIKIEENDYERILEYAEEKGHTFSEIMNLGALLILRKRNKSLSGALSQYADVNKMPLEQLAWRESVCDETKVA